MPMKFEKKVAILLAVFMTAFLLLQVAIAGNQTTSSTTGTAMITRARYYLNESTASFWSDAELLRWLNDGTLDIVARTHCLETTEAETITTGTTSYAITTSFLTVKGVVYNGVQSLRKGSLEHMGDTTNVGSPAYYFTWGNNLIVYPSPESGVSGYALVSYLVTRPTDILAGANVQVPAQFDRALILYIAAQALFKDGQFAKAGRFMAEYYAELDRYRLDYSTQLPYSDVK
jgi:hypothetical protein